MLEVLGIVIFLLLIGASIALHEIGHLVPAKRFGVRVTDYMVGFGPTVWSTVNGETRYGIKAFPVGGYIRMIGMIPPAKDDPSGSMRSMSTGRFATLIADARRTSLDEVGPSDQGRLFYQLPVRKRVIIMLGGPLMNLLLACGLFAVVLVGIGLPQPTLTIDGVVACTPSVDEPSGEALPSGACPTDQLPTPAALSGLQATDVIVSVGPVAASEWSDVSEWVRVNAGIDTVITVDRAGDLVSIPISVAAIERPAFDEAGEPTGATEMAGFLGVRPGFEYVGLPISAVPEYMWDITVRSVEALITLPIRLYELVTETLIGGQDRAIDGPVSVVGASRLGGEIAAMDEPFVGKVATFLTLLASLNLFLFLFNLLPILPLDGGHVAGALYEGSRRQVAKVRGRPDPGPVDVARLLPVAYVVASVLLVVGAIVIWADLIKPISLG